METLRSSCPALMATRLASLTGAISLLVAGCVTEDVETVRPRAPQLLELPAGVLQAGAYHGVTFFFEVDLRREPGEGGGLRSDDLPVVAEWNERESAKDEEGAYYRQLPPIIPDILEGGREVYRLGSLHRVEYDHSMFQVGQYRFLRQPKARLYVFKERDTFRFAFRGQPIVVPSSARWIPSLYYYPEELWDGASWRTVGEVVQVGLATIESRPEEGHWLVNGKKYYPDPDRALTLHDALHSVGTR